MGDAYKVGMKPFWVLLNPGRPASEPQAKGTPVGRDGLALISPPYSRVSAAPGSSRETMLQQAQAPSHPGIVNDAVISSRTRLNTHRQPHLLTITVSTMAKEFSTAVAVPCLTNRIQILHPDESTTHPWRNGLEAARLRARG